ncbi:unnamed protein product [Owenia fusiformis]|uniref:C2H2-type domain-containing protein n=1 Tax=Owenia fusiformis TaxID=6347 RepID=A0A8S4PH13_OWEFU|nr:unnamed protein product [Owenia fusiformis]
MKTHDEGKMFKCKICSVTKIQLMQFVTHVFRHQDQSKHSSMDKISNLMCDICGKIFKGSNYLKLHKSSIHGDKTFNCPSCNRTYGAKKALHRHMKCHGERSNECSTCGMKFVLKENLKYHIASIHSGSKSHKCKACDVGFVYRSQLYTHYRANEECANIADVNVTFFQCEICNKSFTTKKSWTHHKIRTHNVGTSNESRFACKQCSKSYVIQSDLNKHVQRSHVRPHLCSVCGKAFGDKKHLEEHFRRHTGEKPFSCDTCGKRFTQFGSLYKHKHIHLKEFPNPNKIDSDTLNDPIGSQTYQHDDLYTPVNAYVPFE